MTKEDFLAFYPQFIPFPDVVLDEFVAESNLRFMDFLDAAEKARRLYIAHNLTLYAQTYAETSEGAPLTATMSKLSGSGAAAQALSKSVGGVSVSKSEGSATSGINGFAEWKQTEFGLQLIGLAKIAAAGGRWIP